MCNNYDTQLKQNLIRVGNLDDVGDITNVLIEVAPHIPLKIPGDNWLRETVSTWCQHQPTHFVIVSCDENNKPVGFLSVVLNETNQRISMRHFELEYGGVSTKFIKQKRFESMLKKTIEMTGTAPLCAVVKHKNSGGMASILPKYGFELVAGATWRPEEDVFFLNHPVF